MKKIIIIPTYNEKKNITNVINQIIKLYKSKFDILVVDDNSPDKTINEVKKLKKKYNFIKYILRKKKLGIGSAHKIGIKHCYKKKYDLIITMDSDGTHNPSYINKMLNKIKTYDLIITNRFKKKKFSFQMAIVQKIPYKVEVFSCKFFTWHSIGYFGCL